MKPFKIALRTALIIMVAACLSQAQQPPTPTPREQLKQYVADLQKSPSDDTLRERIIKLALTVDPKPVVPEEATVAAAKGKTIFTHASDTGSREDLRTLWSISLSNGERPNLYLHLSSMVTQTNSPRPLVTVTSTLSNFRRKHLSELPTHSCLYSTGSCGRQYRNPPMNEGQMYA